MVMLGCLHPYFSTFKIIYHIILVCDYLGLACVWRLGSSHFDFFRPLVLNSYFKIWYPVPLSIEEHFLFLSFAWYGVALSCFADTDTIGLLETWSVLHIDLNALLFFFLVH